MQNRFFAPEAGEENRKAAQRQHANRISCERHRHKSAQAAHATDILFFMAAVNDRTCAHEKQRLEKGMGYQMKYADSNAPHAKPQHHEAELRDGGISKDTFDI